MTEIVLDKDALIANIRAQIAGSSQLKYQRALLEFEDNAGGFLGDNVFETSFLLRDGQPPLIYEVSGPYDTVSNEYATVGRIYESGKRVFECDMKDQIQQRTAAMVTLFFDAIGHAPEKVMMVGSGKLATETVKYLKHSMPGLTALDYHARTEQAEMFLTVCAELGIEASFQPTLDLSAYDTIIMVTNTSEHLVTADNIGDMKSGAVIASLCTTSQVGEIAGDVYGRDDVNVIFDYDLTRTFTHDMRAANDAGHLGDVAFLSDILNAETSLDLAAKKNILRITGTPMQNVAVLDMMRLR
jgi:ornithine cyclodeaminase/alanine dehydrogenase-like protein (mu-crystallin family)